MVAGTDSGPAATNVLSDWPVLSGDRGQYILEARDPKHRYAQNLRPYQNMWREAEISKQVDFFDWLDLAQDNGKLVEAVEVSRQKLDSERIRYCDEKERKQYSVQIEDDRLRWAESGLPCHSHQVGTPAADHFLFVMSHCGSLYIGPHSMGDFHHSSFLAGGVAAAAGIIELNHGQVKMISADSGHYTPSVDNFNQFIGHLEQQGISMEGVRLIADPFNKAGVQVKGSRSYKTTSSELQKRDQITIRVPAAVSEGTILNLTHPSEGRKFKARVPLGAQPGDKLTVHVVTIRVPNAVEEGTTLNLTHEGRQFKVPVPPGVKPGDKLTVGVVPHCRGCPPDCECRGTQQRRTRAKDPRDNKWHRTPKSLRNRDPLEYGDAQVLTSGAGRPKAPAHQTAEELKVHCEMTELVQQQALENPAPRCLTYWHKRVVQVQAARDQRAAWHKRVVHVQRPTGGVAAR